jgi:hypothetical protein
MAEDPVERPECIISLQRAKKLNNRAGVADAMGWGKPFQVDLFRILTMGTTSTAIGQVVG